MGSAPSIGKVAHTNPDVLAMWERYGAVYVPLHEPPKARDMFAQFEPIDLT